MHAEVDAIALIREAIRQRAEIRGYLDGRGIRLCPHALGVRGEDPYLLGLVLHERQESVADGPGWEWLMEWRWIRLVDLHIPIAQKGDWVACPRSQRPSAGEFLTEVYVETE
jgi:hypothetical protein